MAVSPGRAEGEGSRRDIECDALVVNGVQVTSARRSGFNAWRSCRYLALLRARDCVYKHIISLDIPYNLVPSPGISGLSTRFFRWWRRSLQP